jgi:hypothetical protein
MVEVSAELAARLDLEIERRSSERMPLGHLSRRER